MLYELLNTSPGGTSQPDGAAIVMTKIHFTRGRALAEHAQTRRLELAADIRSRKSPLALPRWSRVFEVLEDGVLSAPSSNHAFVVPGVSGGHAPPRSLVILKPNRANREELRPLETRQLKAGDIIRFEHSSDAGFGPPRGARVERRRATVMSARRQSQEGS